MITIYAPEAQDFSTLGLGALAPYECTVEELSLIHIYAAQAVDKRCGDWHTRRVLNRTKGVLEVVNFAATTRRW